MSVSQNDIEAALKRAREVSDYPRRLIDLFNQIYWLQLAQEGQLKRGAGDYDQEAPANKRSFDNQQQDMNDMSGMGLVFIF